MTTSPTVSPIVASLTKTLLATDKKVAMFTTRRAAVTVEETQNEETFARGASLADGDEALTNLVGEGYAAVKRSLALKASKLDANIAELTAERAAIATELAKHL